MSSIILFLASPLLKVLATTWGIGAACLVVWFLAPAWLPINRSNLLVAGIALMCGGVFYWWAFHAGEDHMAQRIAAKDQAAIQNVNRAVSKVRDCNENGGTWNVENGSCG